MRRAGTRTVVGLGEGLRARKAIDLALKHKKTNFIAVEKLKASELSHFKYLKDRGQRMMPSNLTIKTGTGAGKFLSAQKANSLDHVYSHFLLQHVAFAERKQIFGELMRAMKPGARFSTVEDGHYGKAFPLELQRAGFKVTTKRLSPEEVARMGTDNADMNARAPVERKEFIEFLKTLSPQEFANVTMQTGKRPKSPEDLKRIDIEEVRGILKTKWRAIDGAKAEQGAKDSLRLALRDMRGRYDERPFVRITATKGRARAQ